jgi:hypothetical protein
MTQPLEYPTICPLYKTTNKNENFSWKYPLINSINSNLEYLKNIRHNKLGFTQISS